VAHRDGDFEMREVAILLGMLKQRFGRAGVVRLVLGWLGWCSDRGARTAVVQQEEIEAASLHAGHVLAECDFDLRGEGMQEGNGYEEPYSAGNRPIPPKQISLFVRVTAYTGSSKRAMHEERKRCSPADQKPRVLAAPGDHGLEANDGVAPHHDAGNGEDEEVDQQGLGETCGTRRLAARHLEEPFAPPRLDGDLVRQLGEVDLQLPEQTGGESDAEDACCDGAVGRDEGELDEIQGRGACMAISFWT